MTHPLGATGLPVSSMGLGLAALGRPGYINLGHGTDLAGATGVRELERRTFAVLDAAFAAGVRYFDAARSYGRGEAFLGAWLRERGVGPEVLTVGSKWGYTYTADWRIEVDTHEVKTLDVETLRRQYVESRDRLGDHLRVYQIHSATLDSGVLGDDAVLTELGRLRSEGLAIGLSTSGSEQAQTIRRALETGAFDTVQATWNLLEPSAGPALAAAHEAGLGVILKEVVANGRLAGREPLEPLVDLAAELDTTPDAVAIGAALAQPWADVVLSGAATLATLQSNLAATELDASAALPRLRVLRESPEEYWSKRAGLRWN